jgi:uracil-DNA glycosylase
VTSATERRDRLKTVYEEARGCVRCPLHQTRTQVVFGSGNADAGLMFIGEAPGANEDKQGLPFVGQAGKLLDKLLAEIGLERGDVFIANVLKCRPPGNRDPQPNEIESCRSYLESQVELIEPDLICTLGNFSTKLLRADPTGISRLHGQVEERTLGPRAIRLYPLYHPAAALYTPATLDALRADFHRIPELLALGALAQPEQSEPVPEAIPEPEVASSEPSASPSSPSQSGSPSSSPGPGPGPGPEPESAPESESESATEPEAGSAPERIGPPPPAQLGLF